VLAALLLYTLGLGLYGINRSLWLDEAWVANSIRTPDIRDMFIYREWLQTSPPLFLLLERFAVDLFGLSSFSLRVIPLSAAILAAGAMWAAARHVLPCPWAVLASALLVANPTVIEYSRTVKQYSGEVAVSAVLLWAAAAYFENPSRERYGWLLSAVVIAPALAYSSVFLLPGILLGVALANARRAAALAAVASAEFAALYVLLIRPNYSPELRAFWTADADGVLTPSLFAAVLVCAASAVWIGFRARRNRFLWVCVLPCLLLAASAAAGWYPANARTRLFLLPCFLLLLAGVARALVPAVSRLISTLAYATAILLCAFSLWRQMSEHRADSQEDYASAVSYLHQHVSPKDRLLVHAAASEGFRLYAAIENWDPPGAQYGNTGWPCCARGHDARPNTSTKAAVLADLDAKIPTGFRGRIWLLYPTRPTHWNYVGLNEGDIWRNHVWDRGCPPGPYVALPNLAISPMNCGP